MIGSRFATVLGLGVFLCAQVASAQKIVVLEFDGDRQGRVRAQVVRALSATNEVEFVSIKDFKRIAGQAGFKGAALESPDAVAAVAKALRFQVAIDGNVGKKFAVRFIDADGAQLWTKTLALRRGLISDRDAARLAKAAVAAAKTAPGQEEAVSEKEKAPAQRESVAQAGEDAAETSGRSADAPRVVEEPGDTAPVETAEQRERRLREAEADSHTVTGGEAARMLELEGRLGVGRGRQRPGPKLITVHLGGTTTWRSYCSRPGVASCQEYDNLPKEEQPPGGWLTFRAGASYLGVGLSLEFFPLASIDSPVNGLGVLLGFNRGFSLTTVREEGSTGDPVQREVLSLDDSWHAFATYRYYFAFGGGADRLIGFVGLKGGLAARTFEVDPLAEAQHGSHRRYPGVGVEVSIPIAKYVRIEGGGMYLVNPRAGDEELRLYGAEVTGTGWTAEVGLAGDIWGPIGYSAKFRILTFKDTFTGQGKQWLEGGVAEEWYTAAVWGVTAAF